jgi:hypothetical protein
MQPILNQFLSNITKIREIETLYHHLKDTLLLPNDLSDLLRAQVVYAISALDKLVHELVREGMKQSFLGTRSKTDKFKGFVLRMDTIEKILALTTERLLNPTVLPTSNTDFPEYWFEQDIVLKHSKEAFQAPDKVTDALSHIWSESHKWQKIAIQMGRTEADERVLRQTLDAYVKRRNAIVHEADINPVSNAKNNIEANEAKEIVDFIEELGKAIHHCIS